VTNLALGGLGVLAKPKAPIPRSICAKPLLRSIDLTDIENVPLSHLAAGNALVLDNAPAAVLLAALI
jgi:hypothetical protein